MGGFGMALAGALQGAGAGMVQQAQMDYQTRRETALENLRSQNNLAEQNNASTLRTSEVAAQAKANNWLDAKKTERDTSSKITVDSARTTNDIKIEGVKAANDAKLAGVKHGFEMTQIQAKAAADLNNKMTEAGAEVGEYRVTKDGSMAAYSKTGKLMTQTAAGVFNPTGSTAESEGGILSTARGGIGQAAPAPAPAPKAAAPAAQKPQAKTIPRAQVQDLAQQRGISYADAVKWAQARGYQVK